MAPKKRGRPPGTGRIQILEEDVKAWRTRANNAEQKNGALENEIALLKADLNTRRPDPTHAASMQRELARIQRLKDIIADLVQRL